MKKYTFYRKINPRYFSWSETSMLILPIAIICILTYPILYFLGVLPAIVANVIISSFINFYYHGLRNATPNSSMHVPSKNIPFIVVLLSIAPSFLLILGVLLTANVGGYLIVLYQKTGVFHSLWFAVWCFVVFGLPVLYFLSLQLKHQYDIYYQAYYFTSIPLNIAYDPELLIDIKEITFLNTNKRLLSTIDIRRKRNTKEVRMIDTLTLAEKNDLFYDPVFGSLVHIPKHTNVLRISYYSVSEECYYSDEVSFPYEQLKFEQNKYPLDKSAFLRGKSTDRIVLKIQKGGEIHLYNKHCTLLSPTGLMSKPLNEDEHKKAVEHYMSYHGFSIGDEKSFRDIAKVKASNGPEIRAKLATETFNWQFEGDELAGHTVTMKDVNNCCLNDVELEVGEVKKRHLPISFVFVYYVYKWSVIHVDPEKLYELLYSVQSADPEAVFTFYVSIDLEEGNVSFIVKNKDTIIPFTAWQKELIDHRWEDAKTKKAKRKNYKEQQQLLAEIYELMEQKKYTEAQDLCKRNILQTPHFAMLYFYEARLLWYTQLSYEACYAQEEYLIEKTKHDAYALSRIYNHFGCLLDQEQRYKESLVYFEKAAQTYPEEVFYTANIAEIHYKLKEVSKALKYANECIDKGYTSDMLSEIFKNKGVIGTVDNKQVSIDNLMIELSYLATQYRMSAENSQQHHEALEAYYATFSKLTEFSGGIVALDLDAELPDELMPKEYVDYWLHNRKKENK